MLDNDRKISVVVEHEHRFDDDEGRTVKVGGRWVVRPMTRVAFEREHNVSVVAALGSDEPMESHLFWLAWHASKASGHTLSFDEFLEGLEGIELVVGGEAKEDDGNNVVKSTPPPLPDPPRHGE